MSFRQCFVFLLLLMSSTRSGLAAELEIFPAAIDLRYRTDLQRVVVILHEQDKSREVTSEVAFEILDAKTLCEETFDV